MRYTILCDYMGDNSKGVFFAFDLILIVCFIIYKVCNNVIQFRFLCFLFLKCK